MANLFPFVAVNVLAPLMMATGKLRDDPLKVLFDRTMDALKKRIGERAAGKKREEGELVRILLRLIFCNNFFQLIEKVDFIDLYLDSLIDEQEKIPGETEAGAFDRSVAKVQTTLKTFDCLFSNFRLSEK